MRQVKILIAPDSFKGNMSSCEVIAHICAAAREHFTPLDLVELPLADGGEGTVEAVVLATGGEYRKMTVRGPLQRPITARYGVTHSDTTVALPNRRQAVIEMAQASGLPLVPPGERNPLFTTTYGTGELVRAALDEGLRKIVIGIGGSATNDGGIGFAQALGVKLFDAAGKEVGSGGQELARISHIDITRLDPRLKDCQMTVMCDVTNPLTGPRGATHVFGPQKGATPAMVAELEAGMQNYAQLLHAICGFDVGSTPGAGAAGGLGAALMTFCGATLKPGIETILDLVEFDDLLGDVDLVITGEGRIDGQTAFGKVVAGVAKRCRAQGVSAIALVGSIGSGAQATYELGLDSIMSAVSYPMGLEEAMENSGPLLRDAADRMFRFIKVGIALNRRTKRRV